MYPVEPKANPFLARPAPSPVRSELERLIPDRSPPPEPEPRPEGPPPPPTVQPEAVDREPPAPWWAEFLSMQEEMVRELIRRYRGMGSR